MATSPVLRTPWTPSDPLAHFEGNVVIDGLLTVNGGISGTIFGQVDAIQYASDPAHPTEACVNAAFTAGAKYVIVSRPITINALITVPPSCSLSFAAGVYTVGDLGQISHGITSSIVGQSGSDLTVFIMTATRTIDFIVDTGPLGAGQSSQITGLQIVYPQPDSTNLATYNQFGGAWAIHITKARCFLFDIKIVGGWKGIWLDGSNSFGACFYHLQLACYNNSIFIDGPVDRTVMIDVEIWPFGPPGTIQATANQTTAFALIANTGFLFGRADTVLMTNVFTFCGLGMHFVEGATGIATGVQFSSCGFENNGILMEADGCTVAGAASYCGVDTQAQFALAIGAGSFQGVGMHFYNAIVPGSGVAVTNPLVYCNRQAGVNQATTLDLSNCTFDLKDADQQAVFFDGVDTNHQSAGSIIGCRFNYTTNKNYTNPVFNMGLAAVTLTSNTFGPIGSGSQIWFKNGQTTSLAIGSLNLANGCTTSVLGGSTNIHLLNNF